MNDEDEALLKQLDALEKQSIKLVKERKISGADVMQEVEQTQQVIDLGEKSQGLPAEKSG